MDFTVLVQKEEFEEVIAEIQRRGYQWADGDSNFNPFLEQVHTCEVYIDGDTRTLDAVYLQAWGNKSLTWFDEPIGSKVEITVSELLGGE